MLTKFQQDLARVENARRAVTRDRGHVREGWASVWREQHDAFLRECVADLAAGELEPFDDTISVLDRLTAVMRPPIERRHALVDVQTVRAGGPPERTVDEDLVNVDLSRENHVLMHLGGLKKASGVRFVSKYTKRRYQVGQDAQGRALWAPIWEDDDPLTFNSAGTLRYEDGFSDAMTEAEDRERQALRHGMGPDAQYVISTTGLVYTFGQDDLYNAAVNVGDVDDPDQVDTREETERDGNEVRVQEEDLERQDYAPAITRKLHTHLHLPISREPLAPSNHGAEIYVPTNRALTQAEASVTFEQWLQDCARSQRSTDEGLVYEVIDVLEDDHVLVYGLMPEVMTLIPDPVHHPGQRLARREIEADLVSGLAPDGLAFSTWEILDARVTDQAMRRYKTLDDIPVRPTAPSAVCIPNPGPLPESIMRAARERTHRKYMDEGLLKPRGLATLPWCRSIERDGWREFLGSLRMDSVVRARVEERVLALSS